MNTISLSFSDMCVWIASAGSDEASAPSSASSSPVQEMAKRGVRMGRTSGSDVPGDGGRARMWAMSERVAATDAAAEGST